MIIRVSGIASITTQNGDPATESVLKQIDGASSEDVCSNYLDADLADIGITGGTVKLLYDSASQHIQVITEYESPSKLNKGQLNALLDETIGQWSDGIGESCFDALADNLGVTINLRPYDQPTNRKIEQLADNSWVQEKK